MTSIVSDAVQIGNIILSHVDATNQRNDWLHLYKADGRTYGGIMAAEAVLEKASADVIHIAKKWRLSGVGDKFHNDDWLRLMNADNTGYYGGFATKKLWTPKAFTHVVQLGTKWRLSGVGDNFGDDDMLRLMDIQNTKLYG